MRCIYENVHLINLCISTYFSSIKLIILIDCQRRRHVAMNLIVSQRCLPWDFSLACGSVRVGDRTRASLFGDAPLSSSGNSVSLVCAEPIRAHFTLRYPVLSSLPWNVTEREGDRNHLPRGNCSGEIEFLDETELAEVDSARWRFHNGNTYMFTNLFRLFYLILSRQRYNRQSSLSVIKIYIYPP